MDKTTLEKFFTAKHFRIPKYQREYAWGKENVDDLFTDVAEALETDTNHYIGTFILSHVPGAQFYNLVDGQQRLTTLTMLFHSLVKQLPAADMESRIIRTNQFLVAEGKPRLELLGANEAFFRAVLAGEAPKAETSSQRRLSNAYDHIATRVAEQPPKVVDRMN
jgi:hypothetical protein